MWPEGGGGHEGRMNGSSLQLGQVLGQLLVHAERQSRAMEGIAVRLDGLPDQVARRLPAPPTASTPSPPSRSPLALRDKLYLAAAAVTVLLAVSGRLPPDQAGALLKALFVP